MLPIQCTASAVQIETVTIFLDSPPFMVAVFSFQAPPCLLKVLLNLWWCPVIHCSKQKRDIAVSFPLRVIKEKQYTNPQKGK